MRHRGAYGAHRQLLARQLVHAQVRGLRLALGLEALVFGLQARAFVVRAVGLVEQPARLVRALHQRQATEDQREQDHEMDSRHVATSVRSATRNMAERARGLARTSASDGLIRASALSRVGKGSANGARRSGSRLLSRAMKRLTMRSSSEWKLITARRPFG